jgi:hypothetical protein
LPGRYVPRDATHGDGSIDVKGKIEKAEKRFKIRGLGLGVGFDGTAA